MVKIVFATSSYFWWRHKKLVLPRWWRKMAAKFSKNWGKVTQEGKFKFDVFAPVTRWRRKSLNHIHIFRKVSIKFWIFYHTFDFDLGNALTTHLFIGIHFTQHSNCYPLAYISFFNIIPCHSKLVSIYWSFKKE